MYSKIIDVLVMVFWFMIGVCVTGFVTILFAVFGLLFPVVRRIEKEKKEKGEYHG